MVQQRAALNDTVDTTVDGRPARAGDEWLLTDGRGGFAMGTPAGAHARRYHALYVAATRPPLGRVVALHSLVEQVETRAGLVELGAQRFGTEALPHPGAGAVRCVVELPGRVTWTFREGDVELVRAIELTGDGAVRVTSTATTPSGRLLRVRPFVPLRSMHELDSADGSAPRIVSVDRERMVLARGETQLQLLVTGSGPRPACAREEPQWWCDFAYVADRERGQSWREDVYSPGVLESPFHDGRACVQIECRLLAPPSLRPKAHFAPAPGAAGPMEAAASQFVVTRGAGSSIIAGYPWFADWGRDALIALPGLLLGSGRFAEARSVLMTLADRERDGLLPNFFGDDGGASYNAADTPLWFIRALGAYAAATRDEDLAPLVATARRIVEAYRSGTDFGIRQEADGLVTAGTGAVAVTWMDAARDGVVFTSRAGKAVEINALWWHALTVLARLIGAGREHDQLRQGAAVAASAFADRFWWPELGCLRDVVDGVDGRDAERVRPNQIFAASLGMTSLSAGQMRSIVDVVGDRLLTPYGLRTLDPADRNYRGRFEGCLTARDAAYHNGTVWPWLLGPYADAVWRAGDAAAFQRLGATLNALTQELDRGCVGQLAEVYDGDAPHRAAGCTAQAWSVAEVARVAARLAADAARANAGTA